MSYDPKSCGAMCDVCPLKGSTVVPPERNQGASVAVVGEAPGEQEEKQAVPFVGPSGDEVMRALAAAQLRRRDVHITNVLLCRPPKNELDNLLAKISAENRERQKRNKALKEKWELGKRANPWLAEPKYEDLILSPISACRPRLEAELASFRDIIALGGTAAKAVMNTQQNIMSIRGGFVELDAGGGLPARRVMPTVHPSFVLRSPRVAHVFRNDIYKAAQRFRGASAWAPPQVIYNPSPAELEAFLSQTVPYWTYDLETDGIEPLTAKIRCVGIGTTSHVVIVGLLGRDGMTRFYAQADQIRVIEIMKRFFTDERKLKVGHNSGSYDTNCLNAQWGVWPKPGLDTILLHRLVESELPHGLGFVGSMYTDAPSWKCYDGETEVLTPEGWVRFDVLKRGVQVAQWDNGAVDFVEPRAYVDQPYEGSIWKLSGQATDLMVTPDHKMVFKMKGTERLRTCAVQDLPKAGSLPHVGLLTGRDRVLSEAAIRLLVAFQADGSWAEGAGKTRCLDFGFTKVRKIVRLKGILDELGLSYRVAQTGTVNPRTRIWVENHPRVNEIWECVGDAKQFGPWLLDWPVHDRQVFLDELPLWDGTKGDGHTNYNTTEEVNADWVQTCAIVSGRAARKYRYANANGILPIFRVSLPSGAVRSRTWSKLEATTREEVPFAGRIYCVSVPSGFIVVRRNGKVVVSGNTDREGRKLAFDAETDEQLHTYCLFQGTQVITDRGLMGIEDIVRQKWSGKVLSLSVSGETEWRTVTGWHYNLDKNASWVRVEVEGQRELERGLICTPDHRLIGRRGEVEARDLQPGDYVYDAEGELTEDELQAVLGTVLGDSSLVTSPTFRKDPRKATTAALVGGHSGASGFAEWKVAELPWLALDSVIPGREVSINGRRGSAGPFHRFRSKNMRQLADLLRETYDEKGVRRMRVDTLALMGLRGLAWLLVDDGCVQKKSTPAAQNTGAKGGRIFPDETISISTQGFPREDLEAAAIWFRQKFGSTTLGADGVLRLGTVASRNFALAVVPYVPEAARYKLPRLRDFPDYLSTPYIPVKRNVVPRASLRRVLSVTPYVHPVKFRTQQYIPQRRYCIDVEKNHNFFTTYGLVHNCAYDVSITAAILPPLFQSVQMRKQDSLIELDHKIQKICSEMHMVGMYVDQKKRLAFEQKYIKEIGKRLVDLRASAPLPDFNPGSSHQVRKILFTDWKLVAPVDERDRYTASGDPATSDDILRSLLTLKDLEAYQKDFVLKLRRYRKAQKLLGTYIVKLRPWSEQAELGWDEEEDFEDSEMRKKYGIDRTGIVNPVTGRMYPGYNAHVAVTGRLSSSKPINAQNFPKGLRAMVVPQPGCVFIGADADQLELRIAAARWNAARYLRAFDAGADPHSSTAFAVFGKEFQKAEGFPGGKWDGDLFIPDGTGKWTGDAKSFRDLAKRVQYASQYMATVETVHRVICQTETDNGDGTTSLPYLNLSLREVRRMHEAWLEGCPEFASGWEREIEAYRKQGFLAEPITGRRRDFLDGENPNELVNFNIQGSAAGLMNLGMIRLAEEIPVNKYGPGTGIINQCHDAMVLEVPADGATYDAETKKWHVPEGSIPWRTMKTLEECMNSTHPSLPGVRITATADIGESWKDVG
jgi:DNA polymerase I-like protein with 3'-5' exonuclease and polymerase domains/uracil-DNA glycosylase